MCQSLIAAGKTSAEEIIAEVSKLETFVFSNTISHPAEAKAVQVLEQAQAAEVETPTEPEPVVETEAEAATETQTSAETAPAQVEENAVSFDDVKAALMQVAKKSRTELQEILNHFGAANLSAIQSKDFAEVVRMAEQALETADV